MKGNNQQELSYRAIETQVVGQVLTGTPQDWDIANSIVKAEDFTEPMYTIMWELFTELANAGQGINVTNLYALALTRYDHEKCVDMVLTDVVNGYGDMALLAESVAATAMKRRYFEAINMMSEKMMEPDYTVEEANAELREVININEGRTAGIKTIGQTMHDLLLETQDKMLGIEKPKVLTGFRYIDNRGGLKAGNLDIIAGRTSNGKTSLAMAMALNAARQGTPVAVYSLEMTIQELTTRLASMVSRVPTREIDQGQLNETQLVSLMNASNTLNEAPMYFDTSRTSDVDRLEWSIRQMVKDNNVRLIVLDYLQLLRSERAKDTRAMLSDACVRLKNLAVELDITIVALSQLARCRPDAASHEPKMEQLKEAGEIENSADNVYMVYRAELYDEPFTGAFKEFDTHGTAVVINSKARHGSIGAFMVGFVPECTLYHDDPDIRKATPQETKREQKEYDDMYQY